MLSSDHVSGSRLIPCSARSELQSWYCHAHSARCRLGAFDGVKHRPVAVELTTQIHIALTAQP